MARPAQAAPGSGRSGSARPAVEAPADRTALRPIVAAAVSTRRGIELALLAFAAVITTGALVLVEANQNQELTLTLLYLGAAYLGLFAAAHIAVRKFAPYADPVMLPCAALLNGLGLVMIHRIDLAKAAKAIQLGNPVPDADALKQIEWLALGLVIFVVVMWKVNDHRALARYGYTAGFVGLILLGLPAILPSALSEVNGAKIWIRIGGVGIQPGEFAKILLTVFFAGFLVSKRELFTTAGKHFLGMTFPRPRDLAPLLIAWAVAMGVLVFESDLGTSLMFFGIVLAMIYVATERSSWVLIGLVIFGAGAFAAWTFVSRVQLRVDVWLNPLGDPANTSFQVAQGLFGLATGGMLGTGLGAGRPDLVPLSSTDFIFTSMGEELGLVGLMALLLLYGLISTRALRTALAVRDTFGKLLAAGLGFALMIQVFVVCGGVIDLIPNTGQAAPFMSYGGSSLVANYALVALVLRVSNAARQPAGGDKAKPEPGAAPEAPRKPLAEAHTEMVSRGEAATPPQGSPATPHEAAGAPYGGTTSPPEGSTPPRGGPLMPSGPHPAGQNPPGPAGQVPPGPGAHRPGAVPPPSRGRTRSSERNDGRRTRE
ncbi:FtsW/RodA/SpoVE family cell cycle protein [Actinomycetospora sp.]|jgi:cell division protein FtsW (lipid II flippase)|uniref:FtsW/RodA/SpoVE family cell cycle protein n=1 Tax=Actinomycetospora sp. TaxID=1872135 RepID=UPI002F4156D4